MLLGTPSRLVLVVQSEPEPPAAVLQEAMERGHDGVKPQRDRYVMERLIEDYFEEERGGRKEEERLSHETEEGGERARGVPEPKRESRSERRERQKESKSFSQPHRDRLFGLNCVLWTSEGLRRKPSRCSQPIGSRGRISGRVGAKCNVKQAGMFPWQPDVTIAINRWARKQCERQETACSVLKPLRTLVFFKTQTGKVCSGICECV